MNNYGLVYRDAKNEWIMLGEFNADGVIEDFIEIKDAKYDDLPETLFAVVDVQHTNGRVGLLDLHQFEMYREDGTAEACSVVISFLFGAPDRGVPIFKGMHKQIMDELFSGVKH